jgi:hypothetical protein
MLELLLLGIVAGTTLYGQKVRNMIKGTDIKTLRLSHPGSATAIQHEKNLTKHLRSIPKYNLGVDLEDEDYTKVRTYQDPDIVDIYKKIDPTFTDMGVDNPYRSIYDMRLKK